MTILCGSSDINLDKANPTNFRLIFPKIPTEDTLGAINPFVMNIFASVLPSVTVGSQELRWQGNRTNIHSVPMDFADWNVSYIVDSRLENWRLLFKWMSYINNNYNKIAELHKNYSVDANLLITDNYDSSVLEVTLVSIWPTQLGEVSFNQRQGDTQLEGSVTFKYDYFKVRDNTSYITSTGEIIST